MASFNADILLNTKVNQQSLNKAISAISSLQTAARQIKPINLFAPGGGAKASEIGKELEKIKKVARNIRDGNVGPGKLSSTFAGASQQARVLSDVLANVNLNSKESAASIDLISEAFAKAEIQANKLQRTYEDTIRSARGLQPLADRERQVAGRQALRSELRRKLRGNPATRLDSPQAFADRAKFEKDLSKIERSQLDTAGRLFSLRQSGRKERKESLNLTIADAKISQAGVAIKQRELELARELNKEASELLDKESRRRKTASRRLENIRGIRKERRQNAAVSAAFPALFGGGPGSILGGAIGGLASGALGPLGGVVGSSIGQVLDQAGQAARDLNVELATSTDTMAALAKAGVPFTAELEEQLRLAKGAGDLQKQQQIINEAFSDSGKQRSTSQALGSSVLALEAGFKKLGNAIESAFGPALIPFIEALAAALETLARPLNDIGRLFSALGQGLDFLSGGSFSRAARELYESRLAGTEEYQKQISAQKEQLRELEKQNKLLDDTEENLGRISDLNPKLLSAYKAQEKALERRLEIEKEIKKIREDLPADATREQRALAEDQVREKLELETRKSRRETEEEILSYRQKLLEETEKKEREINKRVADERFRLARQYEDFLLQIQRQQEDLNIAAARRVEDVRLEKSKALLRNEQALLNLQLKRLANENRAASAQRSLDNAFNANQIEANLSNALLSAAEDYELARLSAEEKLKIAEKQAQIDKLEAETKLQRFIEDQARKIGRINEDNALRVKRINEDVARLKKEIAENEVAAAETRLRTIREEARLRATAEKTQAEQLSAQVPFLQPAEARIYNVLAGEAQKAAAQWRLLGQEVDAALAKLPQLSQAAAGLQGIPSLPALRDPSGVVSKAESELIKLQTNLQDVLNTKIARGEVLDADAQRLLTTLQALQQAVGPAAQLSNQLAIAKLSQDLLNKGLMEGMLPGLAEANVQLSIFEQTIQAVQTVLGNPERFKLSEGQREELERTLAALQANKKLAEDYYTQQFSFEQKLTNEIARRKGELTKLTSAYEQLIFAANTFSDGIATGLSDAITAAVTGTETVEEAFSRMFANIGKAFIDMATKILAQKAILMLLEAFASGGTGGVTKGTAPGTNFFEARAPGLYAGGPAVASKAYTVGENGPELFIPNQSGRVMGTNAWDASRQAMQTSSAVQSSTAALDREQEQIEAMQNPAPIDIRYDSTQINSVTYVTEEQMLESNRKAVKEARARVFSDMRNKPGTRTQLGMA